MDGRSKLKCGFTINYIHKMPCRIESVPAMTKKLVGYLLIFRVLKRLKMQKRHIPKIKIPRGPAHLPRFNVVPKIFDVLECSIYFNLFDRCFESYKIFFLN